jgi:hypothetical protein
LLLLSVATPMPDRPTAVTPGTRRISSVIASARSSNLPAPEILDLDQAVAAIAGIGGPGIDGLGVDDRGADDEADRDRELGDDEDVASRPEPLASADDLLALSTTAGWKRDR